MTLPAAILAGGLATRLRPLTETIPKSLVEVAGEPFAFHQLRLLARHGFTEAVFLTGYLGERIEQAVGDGSRFGLRVRYVPDGPVLLGTGGAIARALPALGPRFAVVYGDSWLEFDYQAALSAFERDGRPALMTVFRNEDPAHANNVVFDRGEIMAYSKADRVPGMFHIDYGFSAFNAEVFAGLSTDVPTDLATVTEDLARRRLLFGFEVHHRFHEVGSFTGLADLEAHFSGNLR
ncbi:MAG: sugar phosphate nucleotidyltransferase [Roseococcus sp.]